MGWRPSNISRLQYLVTWESEEQKAGWQWCQEVTHRRGDTHYGPALTWEHLWCVWGHDASTRGLIIRCWRHGARVTRHENTAGHHIMTQIQRPVCDQALVMWESGGKRENDRDPPNMGGPSGQGGERHTSSLPSPSSLLYWYPGSALKYPRAFSIIISPLASRFTLTNSPTRAKLMF